MDRPALHPSLSRILLIAAALLTLASLPAKAARDDVPPPPPFAEWLAEVKAEAMRRGISQSTLESAFADVTPVEKVLEYDRSQPEFTRTFWQYISRAIDETRINRGR